MFGPKVQNLIHSYIRPLNPKLIGQTAQQIESYYSKLYVNPSDIFLYTMPRFQERIRELRLSKQQEESVRLGFAEFSTLAQVLFERKFPEYYHRADKAPPKQQ